MMKKNRRREATAFAAQAHANEILMLVRSHLPPAKLCAQLGGFHERDIAEVLPLLTPDERNRLYLSLDTDALAGILEYCPEAEPFLQELAQSRQAAILSRMEAQDTQAYLRQLPELERAALLEMMNENARQQVALLNGYSEEEIGSRMSTNYVRIPAGLNVREAMRQLVGQAAQHDNISTIYVVDYAGGFVGAIDLKALIIARDTASLEQIMMASYPCVYANELTEACIERIKGYSEDSIPVLDMENRLLVVLTANEIAELVDQEISEDYVRLAGLPSEEELREPLSKSVRKRLPWLIVLMALGLLVSTVVGLFEGIIAHLSVIISFQSLILDMAGNVGTQSLAVTIRVLMDDRISGRDKLRLIGKETRVGLVNGLLLGMLSIGFIGIYLVAVKKQTLTVAAAVSLCTATALLVSIVFSSICGTAIPMLFQKLNIDPAVASGPLITTINDLIAVVTYYGLAWLLLIRVLHL